MSRPEVEMIAQRENLEAIRVKIKDASKSVERLLLLEKLVEILYKNNLLSRSGFRSLKNKIQAASIKVQIKQVEK